MADDQAPDVTIPVDPSQTPNVGQAPTQQPTLAPQSRLSAILGAVAKTASTALAAVPSGNRPSFLGGAAQGARAEQAAQAQQQAIKFKTFDDQVRAANLHNQDLELHARLQDQDDAHQKQQDFQHDWEEAHGISHDTIPNTGSAVTDHLTAQTTANGAASIPAGTHLSADGDSIHIPKQTPEVQAGQLQQYNTFGPILGLPSLPNGAQFVPPKMLDMLQHKMQGYDINGENITADKLPSTIASMQTQRDYLAKNGGSPDQLKALDHTLDIYKSNLKADNDAADQAAQRKTAQQKEIDTNKIDEKADVTPPKAAKATDTTELNSVAYDPNFQNPDGSKGGNVVMSKDDAASKGLTHYKADPQKLNALVAGFNDVQNKLNGLAAVANDPQKMSQVQAGLAAAMLEHGSGIKLEGGLLGVHADTSRINEELYKDDVKSSNQATKDYVTAALGAHEAVTQLPRLQTFGQSSRMTQQQMEAAVKLLPQPGDGAMAGQKMTALQQMIDPLRKQVPHMPGAEQIPAWSEKQQAAPQKQSAPTPVGRFNPNSQAVDWIQGKQ